LAAAPTRSRSACSTTRSARRFNLTRTYAFSKAISFTAGWAYEKFDYVDAQYDGYRYTIPAATAPTPT